MLASLMQRMFWNVRVRRATSSADMSTLEVNGLLYSMIGKDTVRRSRGSSRDLVLGRGVVVGRDDHQPVGAERLGFAAVAHRVRRVRVHRADQHVDPAGDVLHGRLDVAAAFLVADGPVSPVLPRMMTPGTPTAICQSRKRRNAGTSIAAPSSVNGVTLPV